MPPKKVFPLLGGVLLLRSIHSTNLWSQACSDNHRRPSTVLHILLKKGLSLCILSRAEVTASHSSLLSPHCMHRTILPALFPALAYIRVITSWGISAYVEKTLLRACFSGTNYLRALRDLNLDWMHATDLLPFR